MDQTTRHGSFGSRGTLLNDSSVQYGYDEKSKSQFLRPAHVHRFNKHLREQRVMDKQHAR